MRLNRAALLHDVKLRDKATGAGKGPEGAAGKNVLPGKAPWLLARWREVERG